MTDLIALLQSAGEHLAAAKRILQRPELKALPEKLRGLQSQLTLGMQEARDQKLLIVGTLRGLIWRIDPEFECRLSQGGSIRFVGDTYHRLPNYEEPISLRKLLDEQEPLFWELAESLLVRATSFFKETPEQIRHGADVLNRFTERLNAIVGPRA